MRPVDELEAHRMNKRITTHPTVRNRDGMAVIGRTLHDLRGI